MVGGEGGRVGGEGGTNQGGSTLDFWKNANARDRSEQYHSILKDLESQSILNTQKFELAIGVSR